MRVSLFLGAGASAMFSKHTTAEFLQLLPERLDAETGRLYKHLADRLRFKDVEEALQALKDVRLFNETGAGRLVFGGESMPGIKYAGSGFVSSSAELERQIESLLKSHYGWKHDHDEELYDVHFQIFHDLRSETGAVTVFTTNYDTAIETCCRLYDCTCVDGFDDSYGVRIWSGEFDTQNATNPVRLYKLHGSLEWKMHKKYGIVAGFEIGDGPNVEKDMVIMPTLSPKDDEKEIPFSEIFGLMKKEFKEQDACIVVGCSFRDEGINEVFNEFIQDGKTLIAISPTIVKDLSGNFFEQECESASGELGELVITAKGRLGHVTGFAAKFEPDNARDLISKSLSIIQKRTGNDPDRDQPD